MLYMARTCFGMASLALMSACLGHVTAGRCIGGNDQCHQGTWRPIAVHSVPNITRGAIDSVITVLPDSKTRITVFYGFNNPCQLSVTATTRHISDTLDVAFILKDPRVIVNPIDSVPDLRGCPATIRNRVYEVTVNHGGYEVRVVRGFLNDSTTLLATRGVFNP